jgi:SAM-dependent methyltransferase
MWNPEALARDQWIQEHAQKLPPGSRVLDAGAGASKYRPFFQHCQYQTQDFCQYQGELVKYLQPIDYVCDITAIPLPDATLDVILCTEVMEHVADPGAVLSEFARLVKPGGKVLLTAPLLSVLHMEPYHYFGGFTHYWYRYWLPAKGFKVDSITAVSGPGRACAVFGRVFYYSLVAAQRKARPGTRWMLWCCRVIAWPWLQYVLPWVLPKFDPVLGDEAICCEYLVAATRLPPPP